MNPKEQYLDRMQAIYDDCFNKIFKPIMLKVSQECKTTTYENTMGEIMFNPDYRSERAQMKRAISVFETKRRALNNDYEP